MADVTPEPRERDWYLTIVAVGAVALLFGLVLLALMDPH